MGYSFGNKQSANIHRAYDDWDEVQQQMIEVQQMNKAAVQKKSLAVSEPGDHDEKEADEVARKVSQGESVAIHGTGGAQPKLQRKPEYKQGSDLQSIWFKDIPELENAFDGKSSFTSGAQGDHVKRIQQTLQELQWMMPNWVDETGKNFIVNLGPAGDDGIFGEHTLSSLKGAQKKLGLAETGFVDQATMQKFDSIFWSAKKLPKSSIQIKKDEAAQKASQSPAVTPLNQNVSFSVESLARRENICSEYKLIVDKFGLSDAIRSLPDEELTDAELLLAQIEPRVIAGNGYATALMPGGLRYDAWEGSKRLVLIEAPDEMTKPPHMSSFDMTGEGLIFTRYRNDDGDEALKQERLRTTFRTVGTMKGQEQEEEFSGFISQGGSEVQTGIEIGTKKSLFSLGITAPANDEGQVIYDYRLIWDPVGLEDAGIDPALLELTYEKQNFEGAITGGSQYKVVYNGAFMGYFVMQRADQHMHYDGELEEFNSAYLGNDVPIPNESGLQLRDQITNPHFWRFAIEANEDNKGDPDFIGLLLVAGFPGARYDGISNSTAASASALEISASIPDLAVGLINNYRAIQAANRAKAAMTEPKPAIETTEPTPNLKITASNPSASELRAARYMAAQGFEVELRDPVGKRADGGTSDMVVNGVNYDVYTPKTSNPNRVISGIARKNSQATGVVVDLTESSIKRAALGNVLKRVQNAGATNIKYIHIIGGE